MNVLKSLFFCFVLFLISIIASPAHAQFNQGRVGIGNKDSDAFNRNRAGNFNDYRVSLNKEYARMIRDGYWDSRPAEKPKPRPKDDVIPSPTPYDERQNQRNDRQVVIDEIVKPDHDKSRAQPIAPVREDNSASTRPVSFNYLGSQVSVRVPSESAFKLGSFSNDGIATAWEVLSEPAFAAMVADCQKYKSQLNLCDWAYLKFIETFARSYGKSYNEITLLTAYIFSQSGYKIRLARSNSGLELLYNSRHEIFDMSYFIVDGEKFYPLNSNISDNTSVCQSKFPKEKSLSLWVGSLPQVSIAQSPTRTVGSKRYPEFRFDFSINKNLIDFYNSYPTSVVGSDFMTRWAMYAEAPISNHIRSTLYPRIKSMISGMDNLQAVERILNWVQTGFVYEYDDKVWGHDRAFFPEESLYYPYCDCEDRSILFTRLVRDLLGLKCLLIYYPGHLAAAVAFNSEVNGDYLMVNGKKFTVTDPTFIGAPVGRTMTGMDNSGAKVIVLE